MRITHRHKEKNGSCCPPVAFAAGVYSAPSRAHSGSFCAFCAKPPTLARVDVNTNEISAILPVGTAGAEGGITASSDSIWIVTDEKGTRTRIDPRSNSVRQHIAIPPGSYNPLFSDGMIWITGVDRNVLTVVDASSGDVLASLRVGPKPRFLTAGNGSVWTLNQGDGTVSRVDAVTRKVTATIRVGIPGVGGGEICSCDAPQILSASSEEPSRILSAQPRLISDSTDTSRHGLTQRVRSAPVATW